ncbi:hypothetical protein [Planobispora rosea]|uniref:hypothetical protein n=1 Tax=Planobispora rosea TaxID=35762 RepID=UPI00083B6B39|nr:hypothetical protein [Planobispora rosea]
MTATTEAPADDAAVAPPPPDWGVMIDRVANFAPEDDAALVAFLAGEGAAVLAYAAALEQARENCVNDIGLDPSAVAGITTYSEHMSEAAERLAAAHQQFMTVYGEVLALAANGVVMPHNGRWFTGASA